MAIPTSLYLQTSYEDTYADYRASLMNRNFPHWDYVVLTASDENQADGYRRQIALRKKGSFLPEKTCFLVIPDRGGKRVGSGGATLSVIREIAAREKRTDFKGLRILVIHSGGDSKRVPQYSALGKLFSPVPHPLDDGRSSTLFDEFMIGMSSVAPRIREGMVLLAGDVLLLFNPLQIDFGGHGAACISFKENVQTGKNHGVFLNGENGNVKKFLHKQSVEKLTALGAVNEAGNVDIDTGACIFSAEVLAALCSLVADDDGYDRFVNEKVRLSLYADFQYPMAEDSTLEDYYNETPEGEFCPELTAARQAIWEKLSPFRLRLLRLSPAKFIHFGTTAEVMRLMNEEIGAYRELGWTPNVNCSFSDRAAGYNSVLSAQAKIGEGCYLETSYVHSRATVGDHVFLSYIDIHDEVIPSDVVIHGLKQKNGKFVCRIFGIRDNPKENAIFGIPLSSLGFLTDAGTLWNTEIYPEEDTMPAALHAALNVYALAHGEGDLAAWQKANKKSLCSGFRDADAGAIIDWNRRMEDLVTMDRILKQIAASVPAENVPKIRKLSAVQKKWLEHRIGISDFSTRIRLYYYIGCALEGAEGEKFIKRAFAEIGATIRASSLSGIRYRSTARICQDSVSVSLPLRVNFGGGWTDTPPYCNENGGAVCNAALLLGGAYPVQVRIERIPTPAIVFESKDMGVYGEFTSLKELRLTGNPYDNYALQKAALLATGILPAKGGDLSAILARFGGGFRIDSEVVGVPKGSGLGTSSILAAAVVIALFRFFGIAYTNDDVFGAVLVLEQIMSTGGGWQDQVGGVLPGFKMITSRPGIVQNVSVETLPVSEKTLAALNERFCLIYTGERRLARNLLRSVIGNYIGNRPESVSALEEIRAVAHDMCKALTSGDIDGLAALCNRHWALSVQLDPGTTNTLIEQIFLSIEDLIDGRMICGAGGGGFLQVILKKGVSKDTVRRRLREIYQDFACDVWDCTLL